MIIIFLYVRTTMKNNYNIFICKDNNEEQYSLSLKILASALWSMPQPCELWPQLTCLQITHTINYSLIYKIGLNLSNVVNAEL